MRLEHLSLTNFRNYAHRELPVPDHTIVVVGANAQGKTSLLEAFYYLATARSPYTTSDRQLIHWRTEDDPMPFARVSADIYTKAHPFASLEITLVMDTSTGTPRLKKVIRFNGVDRRVMDIVGILNVVMFLPQDLRLVEGSPSDRRRYMDDTLSQVDAAYLAALNTYEKALPQRNALLRSIAANRASVKELAYWNEQIIDAGAVIIAGRQRFLREIEREAQRVHADLTNRIETLTLHYQPGFTPTAKNDGQLSFDMLGLDLHRDLSPQQIAPQFADKLTREQGESINRGVTLSGPHRDELRMQINGRDVGLYGSRGQGRTTVMALKLAELAWMTERIGERPVLLLDEVIAELDAKRRAYLLARLDGVSQTLMTTTEPDIFTPSFMEQNTVLRVNAGQIEPL
ncbi:MAG: DNA replication/repair protein RecF [Chloroflexota bacterium]